MRSLYSKIQLVENHAVDQIISGQTPFNSLHQKPSMDTEKRPGSLICPSVKS